MAKASISEMSSGEAREDLERVEGRRREVGDRLRATRPPTPALGAPEGGGYGRDRDPLEGAGPEYRAAVEEEDPKALAALEEERRELEAEATMLAIRRDQLRAHARRASEMERRDAAPGKANKLSKAVRKRVREYADAAATTEELRAGVERDLRALGDALSLAEGKTPGIDAETLRTFWRAKYGTNGRGAIDVRAGETVHGRPAVPGALVREARGVLELPNAAIAALEERLGGGKRDDPLAETRKRGRRSTARNLVLTTLVGAIVAGEELTDEELVERAYEHVRPRRPRRVTV